MDLSNAWRVAATLAIAAAILIPFLLAAEDDGSPSVQPLTIAVVACVLLTALFGAVALLNLVWTGA